MKGVECMPEMGGSCTWHQLFCNVMRLVRRCFPFVWFHLVCVFEALLHDGNAVGSLGNEMGLGIVLVHLSND